MMILYFDKGLKKFENVKKKPKVRSLVNIVVRNRTSFNNKMYFKRLHYERTLNCFKEQNKMVISKLFVYISTRDYKNSKPQRKNLFERNHLYNVSRQAQKRKFAIITNCDSLF